LTALEKKFIPRTLPHPKSINLKTLRISIYFSLEKIKSYFFDLGKNADRKPKSCKSRRTPA